MIRYYAFYVDAIGARPKQQQFDQEEHLLDFVRDAMDPDNNYRNLVVIRGERLEFEPYTQITAWRIKGE